MGAGAAKAARFGAFPTFGSGGRVLAFALIPMALVAALF
jgi:hypothetical protein